MLYFHNYSWKTVNPQRLSLSHGTALKCVYFQMLYTSTFSQLPGECFCENGYCIILLWKPEFGPKKHPLSLVSRGLSFTGGWGTILKAANAPGLRLFSKLPGLPQLQKGVSVGFVIYSREWGSCLCWHL